MAADAAIKPPVVEEPPSLIPTEKTIDIPDPLRRKTLLSGAPKIGKSTFGAGLAPDETIILACEPGLDAIEGYKVPIDSWQTFLDVGAELGKKANRDRFKLIQVDGVGVLQTYCQQYVLEGLKPAGHRGYLHASDLEYGKGWNAITDEFKLRIAKLCSLGYGVIFIAHEKETTFKTRTGVELTRFSPDIEQKGSTSWLTGYVDYIVRAAMIEDEEGQRRTLQLLPSETVEAGGRLRAGAVVPEIIDLDPQVFIETMREAI